MVVGKMRRETPRRVWLERGDGLEYEQERVDWEKSSDVRRSSFRWSCNPGHKRRFYNETSVMEDAERSRTCQLGVVTRPYVP